jgi:uncharacterized membrane protein YfcA
MGYILAITLGLFLVYVGFNMAFRQTAVRSLLGRPAPTRTADEREDPLAYALRIAGVMTMVFGLAIGGMFVAFRLAS